MYLKERKKKKFFYLLGQAEAGSRVLSLHLPVGWQGFRLLSCPLVPQVHQQEVGLGAVAGLHLRRSARALRHPKLLNSVWWDFLPSSLTSPDGEESSLLGLVSVLSMLHTNVQLCLLFSPFRKGGLGWHDKGRVALSAFSLNCAFFKN